MSSDDIQRLKAELGEMRRWFYSNAKEKLGVDITGVPVPGEGISVDGTLVPDGQPEPMYEFLEPTEYDRRQAEAAFPPKDREPVQLPRIYNAMSAFFYAAVTYLDARQNQETARCQQAKKEGVQAALEKVMQAARFPPPLFPR